MKILMLIKWSYRCPTSPIMLNVELIMVILFET